MRPGSNETLFPFLGRLPEATRRELGAHFNAVAAPDTPLLQRGDPADGAYLVSGGSLRVFYITDDGREATLYRVEPGGTCVLALSSTFNDQPYPAWVQAGERGCRFAHLPRPLFRRLIDTENAFREFVFGAMSGRIFELMCTLEELGSLQVEQRVARYLLRRWQREDGAPIRITQSGIASELGTAREVVFRALHALARRNAIATGRGLIRIVDASKLSKLAAAREDTTDPQQRSHRTPV